MKITYKDYKMKNKNPDFYYFGKCKYCNKEKALKNGICVDCGKKQPKCPDFLKDIFGNFNKG